MEKTNKKLKSLENLDCRFDMDGIHEYVKIKDLRAEAVKWIKMMKDELCRDSFMRFFNITEEDLK